MSTSETYSHGAQRRNNPTAEMATTSHPERRAPRRHTVDVKEKERSRIPTLDWKRKRETKTVIAPMLSTVEKIDSAAWIETLRRQSGSEKPDLFASFDRYKDPDRAMWDWYEHRGNWQNRLIHADAKRAMASLLEHEHMAGEVQCVYFDPPYGMDFDARYMDDAIQVTAFRDSYEGGIHTYLDGIRETAILSRELLSPSGSFFMQIGDVNVHRCAMVLDEVFGPENRVTTITFSTTSGGSSTLSIPKAADFILWYAKDKSAPMQFQLLYEAEEIAEWCKGGGFDVIGAELPGGERPLTADEKTDPRNTVPDDARLWRGQGLLSQNASEGEQGQPFVFRDVTHGPRGLANDQWRVDQAGLQHLADTNRLWSTAPEGASEASARQLYLKVYKNESPGKRISNQWSERITARDKRYAVQTGELAIQRCMLMTTKPGDLVLDPTGGSGTTALVAERWGRRWISIDSSRESLAVTRERVLVHDYPRHLLIGSKEGFEEEQRRRKEVGQELLAEKPEGELDPATGLVVDRMPYVSAATLAYENRKDKRQKREFTYLVDRPAGKKSGRVCSRFTVESELMEVYQRPEDMTFSLTQARRDSNWQERVIRMLDETGIRSDSGQHWNLEGVESIVDEDSKSDDMTPGSLSHTATLVDRKSGRKVPAAIAIWPEDAKIDIGALHRNVREVLARAKRRQEVLVAVGAEFADGTEPGEKGHRWSVEVMRVRAGTDLHLSGVKDRAGTTSLVLVAEPSIEVTPTDDGLFVCKVRGWNEFNPVTAAAHWRKQDDIQMWMLDTDYDGMQFCARRIHLPKKLRKKENRNTLETLLGRDRCPEALKAAFGWESHPFPRPTQGEIAVRIITSGGGMMSWSGKV